MRLAGVVGAVGLLLSSTAAHAVTITNRDDQDHKVTVVEGETKTDHVLKPSQVLKGICAKGCTVRLDDDEEDEYQLEAEDVVSIEEGALYYDTPDTPAGPAPASEVPSSRPPKGRLVLASVRAGRPATSGWVGVVFCVFRPGRGSRLSPPVSVRPPHRRRSGPSGARRPGAARRPASPGRRTNRGRRGS